MSATTIIKFNCSETDTWLANVSELACRSYQEQQRVILDFDGLDKSLLNPMHIVSLACLIECLDRKGVLISLNSIENRPVEHYLWHDLKFKEYWAGGKNYVPAQEVEISNLWRVIDAEKEVHSHRVYNYLKQHFFQSKDLSAVRNSLDEAYYNIFDHAQAAGNAFSFVEFNRETEKLHVAVCDFGVGIARLVRTSLGTITSDKDALLKALEYKFTTGSQKHNMGMGLGNIKDTCTDEDHLIIISNHGKLIANRDTIEAYEHTFSFPGSLIYYELSLSHFENEEIIDTFEL